MECKLSQNIFLHRQKLELIDTLWNVNLNSATAIVTPAAGINRYIMECK